MAKNQEFLKLLEGVKLAEYAELNALVKVDPTAADELKRVAKALCEKVDKTPTSIGKLDPAVLLSTDASEEPSIAKLHQAATKQLIILQLSTMGADTLREIASLDLLKIKAYFAKDLYEKAVKSLDDKALGDIRTNAKQLVTALDASTAIAQDLEKQMGALGALIIGLPRLDSKALDASIDELHKKTLAMQDKFKELESKMPALPLAEKEKFRITDRSTRIDTIRKNAREGLAAVIGTIAATVTVPGTIDRDGIDAIQLLETRARINCATMENALTKLQELATDKDDLTLSKQAGKRNAAAKQASVTLTAVLNHKQAEALVDPINAKIEKVLEPTAPEASAADKKKAERTRNDNFGMVESMLRTAQQKLSAARSVLKEGVFTSLEPDGPAQYARIKGLIDEDARKLAGIVSRLKPIRIMMLAPNANPDDQSMFFERGGLSKFEVKVERRGVLADVSGDIPPVALGPREIGIAPLRGTFEKQGLSTGDTLVGTADLNGKPAVKGGALTTVTCTVTQDHTGRVINKTPPTDVLKLTVEAKQELAIQMASMYLANYKPGNRGINIVAKGQCDLPLANMVYAAVLVLKKDHRSLKEIEITTTIPDCLGPSREKGIFSNQDKRDEAYINQWLPHSKRLIEDQQKQVAKLTSVKEARSVDIKERLAAMTREESIEKKLEKAQEIQTLGLNDGDEIDAEGKIQPRLR